MYIFIMTIHVIVCVVLILVVLLQAGRGGGMTDMMGSQAQNIFGTQTSAFMVKATEVCAILFVITSLSLGILSTHRGKSLMERRGFKLPAVPSQTAPTAATAPETPAASPAVPAETSPAEKPSTSAKG